ncbi:MAG: diaminopropionate ammonia-lyase [bacterium]|jgi:diaminopropionate ammonia-lyase|nr:diaminopropionate ammonia-lyase [bacterium]
MEQLPSSLKYICNKKQDPDLRLSRELFNSDIARKTRKFHRQIPDYHMSPLLSLPNLAQILGIGGLWVKDEARRLKLNSFKVLGGSFAIYNILKEKLRQCDCEVSIERLTSPEVKKELGIITFATATDGNHGRGVAWAAQQLGHRSIVYVHKNTSVPRIEAIRGYGAEIRIVDGNYDDAVRQVNEDSKINGWTVVSDTSWDNYTQIPTWIMQGYTTLLSETQEQLAAQGLSRPSHVFVQAGVGALAASVIGFYHALFPENPPKCIVVEPDNAACLYRSVAAGDGKPHSVTGKLDTIMAGLACGEPSPLAWNILKECAACFVTCPDYIAAKGMRIYATPLKGDPFIISGESGAVTLGALVSVIQQKGLEKLRNYLALDDESQILLINTEGNTDPVYFRKIIWEGANPVPPEFWSDL